MLIGHLPAGYLMLRSLFRRHAGKAVLCAGLIGAVLPDIDMLRFWFIDNKQVHHHAYWTHKPLVWGAIFLFIFIGLKLSQKKPPIWLLALFGGILLHMLLDTIAGDIRWLWPFKDGGFHLVTVPATHGHWIKSFMAHWTFKLEIAIWLVAAIVWLRGSRAP